MLFHQFSLHIVLCCVVFFFFFFFSSIFVRPIKAWHCSTLYQLERSRTHTLTLCLNWNIVFAYCIPFNACNVVVFLHLLLSVASPFFYWHVVDRPFHSTNTHTHTYSFDAFSFIMIFMEYASDLDIYWTVSMDGDFRIDHFVCDYRVFFVWCSFLCVRDCTNRLVAAVLFIDTHTHTNTFVGNRSFINSFESIHITHSTAHIHHNQ